MWRYNSSRIIQEDLDLLQNRSEKLKPHTKVAVSSLLFYLKEGSELKTRRIKYAIFQWPNL
jgi:hypothetical protein